MSMSDFGSARRASHTPRHLAPPDEIMHDALREVSEDDLPKYLLGEACETAGTITDPELKDQALIRLAEGYAKQAEYPTATRLAHSTNDELAEVEALARIAKASGFVTHMDEAYESAKNIPVKSQQIEALAILGENGYEPGYAKARKTLKRHLIFRKLFAAQDTTPQEVAELYYSIGNHGDEVSLIAANEIVKDLEPAVKGELALSMAAKGHRILLDKLLTVNPASITRHPHSPELLRTCAVMYEAEGSTHKARILLRILEPHQEQRSSVMRQVLGILVEGRNEESSSHDLLEEVKKEGFKAIKEAVEAVSNEQDTYERSQDALHLVEELVKLCEWDGLPSLEHGLIMPSARQKSLREKVSSYIHSIRK